MIAVTKFVKLIETVEWNAFRWTICTKKENEEDQTIQLLKTTTKQEH